MFIDWHDSQCGKRPAEDKRDGFGFVGNGSKRGPKQAKDFGKHFEPGAGQHRLLRVRRLPAADGLERGRALAGVRQCCRAAPCAR